MSILLILVGLVMAFIAIAKAWGWLIALLWVSFMFLASLDYSRART